jgi:hypothetical protein
LSSVPADFSFLEPYAFGATDSEEIGDFLRKHGSTARTLLFDGSLLTWFGTRTLKGLQALYDAKPQFLARR